MKIFPGLILLAVCTCSAQVSTHTNLAVLCTTNAQGKVVLQVRGVAGEAMQWSLAGSVVTATNAGVAGTLVTSQTLGTLRSDFSGFAGFYVTNGANATSVTGLGRWTVAGNSQTHTLYLLQLPAVSVAAAVTVNASGATAGAYLWGSTNVTLSPNTTYALVSSETTGGDQFYDTDTTVTCDGSRGLTNGVPCYSAYIGDTPTATSTHGHAFGPLNLRF